MPFTPASTASLVAFVSIVVGVIGLFLGGVRHAYRGDPPVARRVTNRTALGLGIWLGLIGTLVASGRMPTLPLGGFPIFFGSVALVSLATGLSPLGGRLAAGVPLAALVGFHSFRLPLELVLHQWAAQGTIPTTMTWSGQNWDIISGLAALLAAPLANRHRAAAWAAHLIGSVLLVNVIRVAVLSAPVPFGWGVTPPLVVAWHLPYALVGPVCVGGAITGHIVLMRALVQRA